MSAPDEIAIGAVANAVAKGETRFEQCQIARHIMRMGAAALARVGGHEQVSAEGARLAHKHAKAARSRRSRG